jgi:hypothetical protein
LPSAPQTAREFPEHTKIVLPPYSALGPPLSIVKGSLAVKLKLALIPPCPRLQIAITGFTTGLEKVIVSTVVVPPVNRIMPPLLGGGLPTVPPLNVLVGIQLGYPADRPFISPE